MATTIGDTESSTASTRGIGSWWYLTIVHHPTASMIGRRITLIPNTNVVLGRDGLAFGADALADSRLSRQHCRLEVDATGRLVLNDLGSRNGTFRNGVRATSSELAVRDIVRFASVHCSVSRNGSPVEPRTPGPVPASSPAMAQLLTALERLGPTERCVVLAGEADSGAAAIAALLDTWSGGKLGPLEIAADDVRAALPSLGRECIQRTVLLHGPTGDDAPLADELVTAVLALPRSAFRIVFFHARDSGAATNSLPGSEFRRRLAPAIFELPRLRDRIEDLPALIRELSLRHHGRTAPLDHRLVLALLRASWPGNLRSLDQFVRLHLAPLPDDSMLQWREEYETILGGEPSQNDGESAAAPMQSIAVAPGQRVFQIARDGRSFDLPDGTRVSLRTRYALARILRALAEHHRRTPALMCSQEALINAGWPGSRLVAGTGANRVYVAMTSLRKLGLRDVIERGEDGYRLVSGALVRIIEPED